MNKRGIGPVIATALFLVVAVVSIIGFQTWFNTFTSTQFSDIEIQSRNSVSSTNIDSIVGDYIYFYNSGKNVITINKIEVEGIDCSISSQNVPAQSVTEINISTCLDNVTTSSADVFVLTNQSTYSKKLFLKELSSSSSSGISVTFSSNDSTIAFGENVTFTWSTSGASSYEGYGNWSGSKGTSGSENFTVWEDQTYNLTCSDGSSNSSEEVSVSVYDPYWSNVSLLIQPTTSQLGADPIDNSSNEHSFTIQELMNVTNTLTNPFGNYITLIGDVNGGVTISASSDFGFGTGEYTLES